jgi:Thiolase, C-terminal domain
LAMAWHLRGAGIFRLGSASSLSRCRPETEPSSGAETQNISNVAQEVRTAIGTFGDSSRTCRLQVSRLWRSARRSRARSFVPTRWRRSSWGTIVVARELGLSEDVINVEGGAVAHGHPIGATGAVLTTKLIHSMRRDGLTRGLVTLCIGGGQGIALAIEALH